MAVHTAVETRLDDALSSIKFTTLTMSRSRTNGKSYWCTFQLSPHLEDEHKRRTEGDYDHNELQVLD